MMPPPRNPMPLQEKEYRDTLYRLERRAIIPLKVGILLITLLLWVGVIGILPERPVLILLVVYALSIVAQTLWFYSRRSPMKWVRQLTLVSYLVDVVFVTMLIYFDLATTYFGRETHYDFYILYFLLVMRGFALFKTIGETIFVNILISALFILMNYFHRPEIDSLLEPRFTVSLVLIWLVILMSWFVIMIINRQKLELIEVHDKLLRAEGLAHVGELAAGVAHEINNPIGIIAQTAEYLRQYGPENPEELQEELGAIQREAMRCKEIVQEMLTYANPRPVGNVAVDMRALNDEVLSFVFTHSRQNRFEVVKEYVGDPPLIEADPNLIKQALLNLYLNARQAVSESDKGRIVSRIHGRNRGRILRVEVEDNGGGIAEEDFEHIFEPFFTRKHRGTGLGLAVTQRIIETFGGSIAVAGADPHGTIFIADFPAMKR
jgi:signal transduction histidine kinase